MLQKDDDWMKNCMEYEVQGPDQEKGQRGLEEVVERLSSTQTDKDPMNHSRWRKLIKDVQ